jgi:gentisate 1,2-dioxygenase
VGDEEMAWGQHDLFVVPNWTWRHHVNTSASAEAILFSVNDIPALQALGYYREEPEHSLHVGEPPAVPGDLAKRSAVGR